MMVKLKSEREKPCQRQCLSLMSHWESDTGRIRERGLSLPILIIREMRTDDNGCLSCWKVIHSPLPSVTAAHCMMLTRQTLNGN